MTITDIPTELHFEVELFYARQQHLLDGGDIPGFTAAFTEDAVFAVRPAALLTGRQAIGEAMSGLVARFAADGITRHHWFGMRHLTHTADGALRVVYYAMVSHTAADGSVTREPSSVVVDELVRAGDGGLLVASRTITPDTVPG
ncbi:hypothetical protein C7C46_08530 [Streptomyces tateyamensis]|uniref:SnoaL-like domain-containing protein n=1 Tax=Streptomyces tateyamensis TaxID=565073 RepID=A0A2V4NI04_9ACTN|nr:nuclear transport factor 2 family protein [Streptomyces tateyamensis]PYC83783.1 hypothetical protein C7C46_08530 [Streptomyces tateyamensis]